MGVIVPVYNCQDFIAKTIKSILMQTYSAFEIIAINDGSKDNSLQVLEQFAAKITKIDKLNRDVSSARNTGIVKAAGDWIAFLDGDDVWLPQKLELIHQAIQASPKSVAQNSEFSPRKADTQGSFPAIFDYGSATYKQKWYGKSRSAMLKAISYKQSAIKPWI